MDQSDNDDGRNRQASTEEDRRAPEEHPVGRKAPESGTRYSAKEIHDTVVQAATDELHRPWLALWWSALAAGLLISFSFLGSAFLAQLGKDEHWQKALVAVGYPLGFLFVVLSSTQLFTENTLDPILPLLETPNMDVFKRVARLWGILLLGNIIGALIMGVVLALTPVTPTLSDILAQTAEQSTAGGFWQTFYLAIFGGWLIALMAWLISSTPSRLAQIVLIWLTTAPISAFGFRHCIAGAVEAFFRAAHGNATWGAMVGHFIVPAIFGNAVGGVLLVALLFYGQVRSDKRAANGARHREAQAR